MNQEIKLPPLPETEYLLGIPARPYESEWISSDSAWDDSAMQAYATAAVEQDRGSAPPDGSWRQAVDEALIACALDCTSSHDDPKAALSKLIDWHVQVALDPAVSSAAQALIDADRAQRGEPVAWMVVNESGTDAFVTADPTLAQADQRALPLYTAPQPSQPAHTEAEVQELMEFAKHHALGTFSDATIEDKFRRVLGVPKP